jgi:hypothetical protein
MYTNPETQTANTADPAFIEGIDDPNFWEKFNRYDAPLPSYFPKNAMKKLVPQTNATVALGYLDSCDNYREILRMKAKNASDASDLATLFASLPPKPGSRRIVTISPVHSPAYEG